MSLAQDADDWWDGIEEEADRGGEAREDASDDLASDGGDAALLSDGDDDGDEPADDER